MELDLTQWPLLKRIVAERALWVKESEVQPASGDKISRPVFLSDEEGDGDESSFPLSFFLEPATGPVLRAKPWSPHVFQAHTLPAGGARRTKPWKVAIFDTGFCPIWISKAKESGFSVFQGNEPEIEPSGEDLTHGTHIADIVLALSPESEVVLFSPPRQNIWDLRSLLPCFIEAKKLGCQMVNFLSRCKRTQRCISGTF